VDGVALLESSAKKAVAGLSVSMNTKELEQGCFKQHDKKTAPKGGFV
jgi:hypothetical protein